MPTAVPTTLTLKGQIAGIVAAGWKDPIVMSAVGLIMYRHDDTAGLGPLDDVEVLITRRLRGARIDCDQCCVGGYVHPDDTSLVETAVREAREELGVVLARKNCRPLAVFGRPFYRAALTFRPERKSYDSIGVDLDISTTPAEPGASYTLTVFIYEAEPGLEFSPADGEVAVVGWKTLRQVITDYGQRSDAFNGITVLFAILKVARSIHDLILVDFTPASEPGHYEWL